VIAIQWAALVAVVVAGTAVVLTYDPRRQAVTAGVLGLALALLFFSFQAPDVALSEMAVGSVMVPALVLLSLARIERSERDGE
jgi:energy-converting hydrogenase B subunit D